MCTSLFAGSIPVSSTIFDNHIVRRIIMSVRHIHAKPGEYIAVHRGHGGGGGSSSGGGEGCLGLLAIIFVIWFIASFWKILVALAILCAVIWLIWIFRRPIWQGLCWIFTKLANLVCAGYRGLQSYWSRKKLSQQASPYSNKSADYGKIRQHRR